MKLNHGPRLNRFAKRPPEADARINILEGSVQKAGNRVRITAQLINATNGYHIWSQRYDREIDDIFALQDDICSKISEHLKLTLLQRDETAIEKRPTNNLQAYEMFLKGGVLL